MSRNLRRDNMTLVKFYDGENEIHNDLGLQAYGSFKAGLEGLNPKELLESSIGLCISIVMKNILERDNLLTDDIQFNIDVRAHKDENGANRFSKFTVRVDFPSNLDSEYKKKLMVLVEKGCTISNTLKNISEFEIVDNDSRPKI
ncbi:OsmC family protein [Tissierella creatinini]|nr:OsmC family protein [Tissierella creatinini]TJX64151.1 OsmC family protein [Soehngenia saccharolytica]